MKNSTPSPWTTTWLLGTSICWPSLVCAYWSMVAPGWAAAAALVMVRVWRPWTPSVPLLASWMAPPCVIATAWFGERDGWRGGEREQCYGVVIFNFVLWTESHTKTEQPRNNLFHSPSGRNTLIFKTSVKICLSALMLYTLVQTWYIKQSSLLQLHRADCHLLYWPLLVW